MSTKLIKRPDGTLASAARKSPPRKDKIFRRLERSIPRQDIENALAAAPGDRAQTLLMRMLDPSFRRHSLPQLAKDAGVSYTQLLKLIRDYRLDQGLLRMTDHLPQVMEDVAVDAKSSEVTCGACKGDKVVPVFETVEDPDSKRAGAKIVRQKMDDDGRLVFEKCLVCDGIGTLRKVGNSDARKLMFETLKLTGQRAPLVAQQFNVAGMMTVEDEIDAASKAINVVPATVEPVTDK